MGEGWEGERGWREANNRREELKGRRKCRGGGSKANRDAEVGARACDEMMPSWEWDPAPARCDS